MRVLLFHQYFKTPEEGSGIRSYYLAKAFQQAGYQVKVISGHNSTSGEQTIDGIPVHYFKVPYSNYQGFLSRVLAFLRFVSASKKLLKHDHEYDLLYVLSTPLTTGLIALYAKKKFGIEYLFEVGDLWPLAPIQMGAIKPALIQNKLYQFEERVYKDARLLVGLSTSIKQVMEYTIDYSKEVHVLSNMSDCSFFQKSKNIPPEFNTQSPLIIGYQGAIGRANHLEYLVMLAEAVLKKGLPVEIRIMGDGAQKKRIEKLSAQLSNIIWITEGGKNEVREELSNCHISYISYAPFPVLETGSPNKLFDGLAAGKLIILNFKGWMSELVTKHKCGFSYNVNNIEEAVSFLQSMIKNPLLLEAYQNNARELAASRFDVSHITQNAVKLLASQGVTN